MGRLNFEGLTNLLLLVITFSCATLAYVFTTPSVNATKEPAQVFQFNPQGSLSAVIDLNEARVISLESTVPMKDLSVTINHPDTIWMEPLGDNKVADLQPKVINHFWRTEIRTELDTVLYNPYPVISFSPLAAKPIKPNNKEIDECWY